jgi:hypothetical protein
LERARGQVSEVNIFERRDLSSCVEKKVTSPLDITAIQTVDGLTFLFAEMKASFIDKGPGLFV